MDGHGETPIFSCNDLVHHPIEATCLLMVVWGSRMDSFFSLFLNMKFKQRLLTPIFFPTHPLIGSFPTKASCDFFFHCVFKPICHVSPNKNGPRKIRARLVGVYRWFPTCRPRPTQAAVSLGHFRRNPW